ncbi:aspartate-semialdehyde dehydrogenase [Roseomonas alkaliterrae]|uniref:Aspartate-semialdehyde dehydrogenase n=1 Tax=Neoroseomonas alkaliterrae TaxID=1452450 RepID=A0A840XY28_9PROT|nr:aspartate-semialdehyde dehydrogenase [Neoroseomonas alkaliterrae]MBB5691519.1 aspartate-semialdehyde dehydrogenase [Neoroseomonas alkaliterrae]MBR0676446.1 aspartate-semialdehyde dehydrogenase [Neoroseomonas alkaliterrae]
MAYRVAVVGATGAVGREVLKTLAERGFPVGEAVALAQGRTVGAEVSFGEAAVLKVRDLDRFDFAGMDLALFSAGAAVSAAHAPRAAAAGCLVIDSTPRFRMEPGVPLVVPEVNPQAIAKRPRKGIVANPDGAAIQMVMALKPLHDIAKVRRVVVATYESVSGAGKEAMDELWSQTRGVFVNDPPAPEQFTKPIAFNVIPHIDAFMEDGATREEWTMAVETRKILDPDIQVMATCVRVPVMIGHAEAVHAEFERPITERQAREVLRAAPGVTLLDARDDGGYATPIEIAGEDAVFVSRLRRDPTVPNGLAFWCVADNLRKGAALNAVQIAEAMHANGTLGTRLAGILPASEG